MPATPLLISRPDSLPDNTVWAVLAVNRPLNSHRTVLSDLQQHYAGSYRHALDVLGEIVLVWFADSTLSCATEDNIEQAAELLFEENPEAMASRLAQWLDGEWVAFLAALHDWFRRLSAEDAEAVLVSAIDFLDDDLVECQAQITPIELAPRPDGSALKVMLPALACWLRRETGSGQRAHGSALEERLDDIVFDHLGTSREASAVNNAGAEEQLGAVLASLGDISPLDALTRLFEQLSTGADCELSLDAHRFLRWYQDVWQDRHGTATLALSFPAEVDVAQALREECFSLRHPLISHSTIKLGGDEAVPPKTLILSVHFETDQSGDELLSVFSSAEIEAEHPQTGAPIAVSRVAFAPSDGALLPL